MYSSYRIADRCFQVRGRRGQRSKSGYDYGRSDSEAMMTCQVARHIVACTKSLSVQKRVSASPVPRRHMSDKDTQNTHSRYRGNIQVAVQIVIQMAGIKLCSSVQTRLRKWCAGRVKRMRCDQRVGPTCTWMEVIFSTSNSIGRCRCFEYMQVHCNIRRHDSLLAW